MVEEAEFAPAYLKRELKPWVKKARQGLKALGRS
jgi:hypothetical protein